ncbi:hypothetical protein EU537_11045 [Candidatus Thorarchaeota archaeon]|nr:MAG: hypothetical protein EU537_11045 [Candidatus Thorarchaeota archaeon]
MSSTWYIAKEYLKRLELNFEEQGRKTFSLVPQGRTETKQIEVFPGENWVTLTTELMDISHLESNERSSICEKLLRTNAKVVEISFGINKNDFIVLRNAVPVKGISYDAFISVYEAHLSGIEFFHEKLKDSILG